jgi:PAS domain S-box-containing protein
MHNLDDPPGRVFISDIRPPSRPRPVTAIPHEAREEVSRAAEMTDSGFCSGTGTERANESVSLDLLMEHAPFPWALIDRAGRYLHVSPAFIESFGYTLDDLQTDRAWVELAFPESRDREIMLEAWRGDRDDMKRPRVFRVRCRNGLDRSVLLHRVGLEDSGRLEIYEDVSGLVHHHEALKVVNRRLMDIIEFLPDPTFVIDKAETVIAWNRAIETLSGVSKEEMLGRGNDAYAAVFYGCARPLLIDLVLSGASEGLEAYMGVEVSPGTLVAETFVPTWNNGTGVYLWGKASLLYSPDGEVVGAIESIRDITGRKRTEQQLRHSEAKYRALVESVNDIIYAVDPTGRITYISPVVSHILGYTPEEVIGRSYFELVHSDDLELARSLLAELVAGRSGPNEFRMRARSGETRWVRTWTRPIMVEGSVVELRGVLTDITDRKLADAALRRNEALLARMADASPFGYYVVDTRTDGILYFNDRFLEIWRVRDLREGLCRGELRNRDLAPRLLPRVRDPRAYIASNMPLQDPENRDEVEDELALADGRTIRRFSAQLRDDEDRFFGRLYLFEDITEQQLMVEELRQYRDQLEELVRQRTDELTRANEKLRDENRERMVAMRAKAESEDRLNRIFEQAPIGMAVVSLDDRFLRVNDALCRITGYPREALLTLGPYDITHADDIEAGRELSAQLVRGELDEYVRDKRYIRQDGTTVCVHMTIGVVRDQAKRPLHLLSMVEDVTARVKAEEQLRVYAEALRESNKDLQQFAYVASHDLQEPLRSIVSFSQLLERRLADEEDRDIRDFLAFIIDGGQRMQTLIQDLLVFSRVMTTGRPLEPTDTGRVVAEVTRSLSASIEETGAVVNAESLPTVPCDSSQLAQVFANLIGNAIKYRSPDRPPEIGITSELGDGCWRFAVRDNGIGIAPEYHDRIFEVFQRLHTQNEYEGTGIGLAVVKRIVERHGGRCWLESTPGEGSTFFFTLPAV